MFFRFCCFLGKFNKMGMRYWIFWFPIGYEIKYGVGRLNSGEFLWHRKTINSRCNWNPWLSSNSVWLVVFHKDNLLNIRGSLSKAVVFEIYYEMRGASISWCMCSKQIGSFRRTSRAFYWPEIVENVTCKSK